MYSLLYPILGSILGSKYCCSNRSISISISTVETLSDIASYQIRFYVFSMIDVIASAIDDED